ncbi:MAG: UvrD-helicase domain-containing protein, partial [Mariprofundaceae bacterium]|nr:UvrD-helicase domain-containing protein [Mariprofundaceae bacterium]
MNPIILDPNTTLSMTMQGIKLIEASAGTGKTFAIGNLYLRMILQGKRTEEILVVTFTNAATEELRGRIRQRIHAALKHLEANIPDDCEDELLKLWHKQSSQDDIQHAQHRLKVAITSMDVAAIYTIHAFCQKMLTEHAFHSGQAFDVEMLTDDSTLWEEALKDWWRNQIADLNQHEFALFQRSFASLESLISLEQGLRQPSVTLRPDTTVNLKELTQSLNTSMQDLGTLWQQERPKIETILLSGVLTQRKAIYKKANIPNVCATLDDYFSAPDIKHIPEALEALRLSELSKRLKKGYDEKDIDALFFVRTDEVLNQIITLLKTLKASLLAEAHRYADDKVSQIKQQLGQLSFNDQLVHLQRAISSNRTLVEAIRQRFPIAMIDEFQDTDSIQYDIFRHVYPSKEAQEGQETKQTFIMIGDPKQAIYSFRGGDIFTYMQAKEHADEHYTLASNWRSTPAMISAVNHLFEQHETPFLYDAIPFSPVQVPNKTHPLMSYKNEQVKAL